MKRRRAQGSSRGNKTARRRGSPESDGGSSDSEELALTNDAVVADSGSDGEQAGAVASDDGSDDEAEDDRLDFTQTDYALQMSQGEPATQESEGSKPSKAPSVPARIAQLPDKAVENLTSQLVRYMMYKGGLKLPIKFQDISKDVFPKHKNVSRFFFHRAKKQLEDVFGYRVVQVEDSSSRELYLVLNAESSQEHLLLLNKTGKSVSRGLLMMVLGLLWCAPARRLSEEDLWKQLASVDRKVKENREHPQLGDVSQLLKTFENQLYLQSTSELDADLKKVRFYVYGARTFLEVGKVQILNFVCKLITGRPPTETQVNEVAVEDN